MRKTLSVAIVTQDEEAELEQTLSTVAWADEIVIVNSGRGGRTEDIARRFHAKLFDEEWKGFAAQKNSALEKCTCDWILPLNAGEALSDGLAKEIGEILRDESALDGYAIPRRNFFLGRRIRFGGVSQNPRLGIFRRGRAKFEPCRSREKALFELGPAFAGKAGLLKGYLAHYGYPTLYAYIEHMDRYNAPAASPAAGANKRKPGILSFTGNVLLNPAATFLYNYILRLGFLDGREGLLLHMYRSVYMSWKHAKAWEMSRAQASSDKRML